MHLVTSVREIGKEANRQQSVAHWYIRATTHIPYVLHTHLLREKAHPPSSFSHPFCAV